MARPPRGLHLLAVERDIAVAAVRRPRIDHLHDLVGGDVIVGAERNCLAAVEVDVRDVPGQRGIDESDDLVRLAVRREKDEK